MLKCQSQREIPSPKMSTAGRLILRLRGLWSPRYGACPVPIGHMVADLVTSPCLKNPEELRCRKVSRRARGPATAKQSANEAANKPAKAKTTNSSPFTAATRMSSPRLSHSPANFSKSAVPCCLGHSGEVKFSSSLTCQLPCRQSRFPTWWKLQSLSCLPSLQQHHCVH